MEKEIIVAGKLLTEDIIAKLYEVLGKKNTNDLKKQMAKLFTFKNIYNMHDEHLAELAECIIDLWESDNQLAWASGTEAYVRARMSSYRSRKKEKQHKMQWAKATKHMGPVDVLDMTYELWVYEYGFEYSHFQMYGMLCRIIQDVLHCKEGMS